MQPMEYLDPFVSLELEHRLHTSSDELRNRLTKITAMLYKYLDNSEVVSMIC